MTWTTVTKETLEDADYMNAHLKMLLTETPEEREARLARARAKWAAEPWRVRVLYPLLHDMRYRIGHAVRALRGEHCEWD